ncbi:amidohydrolase [Granulosicoccus antarcticus]|uniref:Putative hydrolase YxeP n=1 Tax=Granulosicoccus antarcticus IMCC3135 TaxID=1192854 RepID=A0A2Z2NN47_9GAMM|nr:amidohydrolase [Granulosicoccus antarcticus]ASJ70300.1 putative hydrolase YxeP [Granulosicoccus antarcticus IMCC3135]
MKKVPNVPQGLIQRSTDDRRWLHANPELGFELPKTVAYVVDRLSVLGIPHETGIGQTGIVASIKGRGDSGRAIGFRADMDALPIAEETDAEYQSTVAGRMHACGHDGHTAILLGLAELLSESRDFDGTVRLVFQPAEEGFAGARHMVEDGLFERFPMERIFGLHNWPDLPANVVGTQRGPIMAASHLLRITLAGKGGHAAMPHQSVPLMTVAAHVQLALNSYVAQQVNAQRAVVVSMTQVISGDAISALPEHVQMIGSVRILHGDAKEACVRGLSGLIEAVATGFGASAQVEFIDGYPVTVNDADSTRLVERAVANLGLSHQCEDNGLDPSMASEDFAFMLEACPGSYFWLGQGATNGRALHAPTYDFNDDTIGTGIALFAEIARVALSNEKTL